MPKLRELFTVDAKPCAIKSPQSCLHPTMAVPKGEVLVDFNFCEDVAHFDEFRIRVHSSNITTSTVVLLVFEGLVDSHAKGVGVLIAYDFVGIANIWTGFDIECPVKRIEPIGLFLALPKLEECDPIGFRFFNWLWEWVSLSMLMLCMPT
jgi:hypothetical protein